MNTISIFDGRLVDDPREFTTKAGETMGSIRIADNGFGKETPANFFTVTLNPRLWEVVKNRGVSKGDKVAVAGEFRVREYTTGEGKKAKKGQSFEIRFPSTFLILSTKAEPAADDEWELPAEGA